MRAIAEKRNIPPRPGAGTGMSEANLTQVFTSTNHGVLVTLKRDGRPQISAVTFGFDAESRTAEISITDSRAKTKNLRRDPRVSLYAETDDGWSYAVAEGAAELSEVAQHPDDAATDALVNYYRNISGEHPDWDEYRQVMVDEGRVLLTIRIERLYGLSRIGHEH